MHRITVVAVMIVCPVCGEHTARLGDEDETYASEIVMRRVEGERIVRIYVSGESSTDVLLHECDPAQYNPVIPWNSYRDPSTRPTEGRVIIEWSGDGDETSPLVANAGWTAGATPPMDNQRLAALLREVAAGLR